jgi:hypothetical protein
LGYLPEICSKIDPSGSAQSVYTIDSNHKFISTGMARKLNVAVQPAVADARWLMSKMDFRSNEADRTASGAGTGVTTPEPASPSVKSRFPLPAPVVAAGASSPP